MPIDLAHSVETPQLEIVRDPDDSHRCRGCFQEFQELLLPARPPVDRYDQEPRVSFEILIDEKALSIERSGVR